MTRSGTDRDVGRPDAPNEIARLTPSYRLLERGTYLPTSGSSSSNSSNSSRKTPHQRRRIKYIALAQSLCFCRGGGDYTQYKLEDKPYTYIYLALSLILYTTSLPFLRSFPLVTSASGDFLEYYTGFNLIVFFVLTRKSLNYIFTCAINDREFSTRRVFTILCAGVLCCVYLADF